MFGDFFLIWCVGEADPTVLLFSLSLLCLSEVYVTLAELRFWFISELSSLEKSKIRLRILLEALF